MAVQMELIDKYLNDEVRLYQDWYHIISQEGETATRQIAKPPSLPELKEMAKRWVQKLLERNLVLLKSHHHLFSPIKAIQ